MELPFLMNSGRSDFKQPSAKEYEHIEVSELAVKIWVLLHAMAVTLVLALKHASGREASPVDGSQSSTLPS